MRRLLRTVLGILCLVVAAIPAAAQGVLPSSFAGWSAPAVATTIPPAGIDSLVGPDASAFREYIVKSAEQRAYSQGTQTASITLYRLRDPSSAYGAFTFLRNDSLTDATLGSYSAVSKDRALIVVGEMLLDVAAPEKQARPS
ncbi:MAG TPA: DUF6599 family protein, partial [Candidatus Acidoferrales bacterium]|nr:DUF6599 family protein [Candidatus Acidoferrales bacterium]